MKAEITVAVAQVDIAWLEPEKNLQRMQHALEEVADGGHADLVVLPELANSGWVKGRDKRFGREYMRLGERIPGPFVEGLADCAKRYRFHVVAGLLEAHATVPGTVYNTGVMISPDGEVIGHHRKMHIPGEERHYFYPGNTRVMVETELGNIGLIVCADRRFPELTRVLTLMGAEMVCCPSNIPGGKMAEDPERAYAVPRCRALENRIFFIESNRVGTQEELEFSGRSSVAGPTGELLARSETDQEEVIRATLCANTLYEARGMYPDFRDRRPEHYGLLTEAF
jgi:predicted amidohydrolase